MNRRVVVTGLGAVTPIGNNVQEFWEGIKAGKNGIAPITHFDTADQKTSLGAEVKGFEFHNKRDGKRMDLSSQYAVTAAMEAMEDSGLISGENISSDRLGVVGATGIGGIMTLEKEAASAAVRGIQRTSAFLVPMVIPNIIAGNVAIALKANAQCIGLVTACAAGTHSIGEGMRAIRHGYADAMIAGGAEASFAPVCFSGFANIKALSTSTDADRASIPFDKERGGFVMGEGSGFMILEELEHAKKRGAKIYAEVAGFGSTCDAYHITLPDPSGEMPARGMSQAMNEAGVVPSEVDYINAHGTGTPPNDAIETKAIKMALGDSAYETAISSTKSMIGHLLGAAGAVEAIVCIKAMEDSFIPATINLRVPDEELDLDYVPNEGRAAEVNVAMSNSLGFGGHNGTLLFKKL